jgi:regulator of chromosome condensation
MPPKKHASTAGGSGQTATKNTTTTMPTAAKATTAKITDKASSGATLSGANSRTTGKLPTRSRSTGARATVNGTVAEGEADATGEIFEKTSNGLRKRGADENEEAAASKRGGKRPKTSTPIINHAPKVKLDVYVCGGGDIGVLGLGTGNKNGDPKPLHRDQIRGTKRTWNIMRPRLNDTFLAADTVGVVQLACAGQHVAAVTHDNKVLTWGSNDSGALGRDSEFDHDIEDPPGSPDDKGWRNSIHDGKNPHEWEPEQVHGIGEPGKDVVITSIAVLDSATFYLTDIGEVYGHGTISVRCLILLLNYNLLM